MHSMRHQGPSCVGVARCWALTWPPSACGGGLVDEIPVYLLPVRLGDGIRFSSPGLARIDVEPVRSTTSGVVSILRFRVRK
jgi:hypothetical protein